MEENHGEARGLGSVNVGHRNTLKRASERTTAGAVRKAAMQRRRRRLPLRHEAARRENRNTAETTEKFKGRTQQRPMCDRGAGPFHNSRTCVESTARVHKGPRCSALKCARRERGARTKARESMRARVTGATRVLRINMALPGARDKERNALSPYMRLYRPSDKKKRRRRKKKRGEREEKHAGTAMLVFRPGCVLSPSASPSLPALGPPAFPSAAAHLMVLEGREGGKERGGLTSTAKGKRSLGACESVSPDGTHGNTW